MCDKEKKFKKKHMWNGVFLTAWKNDLDVCAYMKYEILKKKRREGFIVNETHILQCERDVKKYFLVCLLNTSSKISNFVISCEVHSEKEKQTIKGY